MRVSLRTLYAVWPMMFNLRDGLYMNGQAVLVTREGRTDAPGWGRLPACIQW